MTFFVLCPPFHTQTSYQHLLRLKDTSLGSILEFSTIISQVGSAKKPPFKQDCITFLRKYVLLIMSSNIHQQSVNTWAPVEPKELCDTFCTRLGLTAHTLSISKEILGKLDTAERLGDQSALTIAACSVYIASHITGQPRTAIEISSISRISEETIRSVYTSVHPELNSIIDASWYLDDGTPRYEAPSLDRETSTLAESQNEEVHIPGFGEFGNLDSLVANTHSPSRSSNALRSQTVDHGNRFPNVSHAEATSEDDLDEYNEPEPSMPKSAKYLRDLEVIPVANLATECQICTLCFDSYLTDPTNEKAVKLSPCGHIFGHSCLEKWLCQERKTTCPMCRVSLYQDDTIPEGLSPGIGVPWILMLIEAIDIRATPDLASRERYQANEFIGLFTHLLETTRIEAVDRGTEAPAVSSIEPQQAREIIEQFTRGLETLGDFSYSAEVRDIFSLFRRLELADAQRVAPALASQMGKLYVYLRGRISSGHVPALWDEHGPPVRFLVDPNAMNMIEMVMNGMVELEASLSSR